jgi:transcriptional regulator with XRE-family HTH domain
MDVTPTLVPAGDATAFGALLRAARECRGLSIEELSDSTRIPRGHVEALEEGDFALVPPGLYRRAEVRAYAECVGLDVPLALAQLRSASAPSTSGGETPAPRTSPEQSVSRLAPPPALDFRGTYPDALPADAIFSDALLDTSPDFLPDASPDPLPDASPDPLPDASPADTTPPQAALAGSTLNAAGSTLQAARSTLKAALAAAAARQPRVVGIVALAAFCAGLLLGEHAVRDPRSEDRIDAESPGMPDGAPFARLARLAADGAAEFTTVANADESESPALMLGRGPRLFARPSVRPGDSEFGVLVIHTQPEGARVTVNGIGRGITPVTVRRLLLGSQRVRAAKDGYISEERVVSLGGDGLTRSLRMELRPVAGGRSTAPRGDPVLVVTSRPEGARVTVNGIGWGMTPLTVRHLPQGLQRVRLTKDQYLSEERVVQLGEGRNHVVNVSLRSLR